MCKLTKNEIEKIRNGDNAPLGRLYAENYKDLVVGMRGKTKSQCSKEDMEDALQDAFFVIRRKIIEPAFRNDNICGFIVTIAYNKLRGRPIPRITGFDVDEIERYLSGKQDTTKGGLDDEQLRKVKAILKAWEMQGAVCKKILTLLWEEERKLNDIWKELGYKNYGTIKSGKSRCVKKLRKKANDLLNQQKEVK